jgi:hypothetical protein
VLLVPIQGHSLEDFGKRQVGRCASGEQRLNDIRRHEGAPQKATDIAIGEARGTSDRRLDPTAPDSICTDQLRARAIALRSVAWCGSNRFGRAPLQSIIRISLPQRCSRAGRGIDPPRGRDMPANLRLELAVPILAYRIQENHC